MLSRSNKTSSVLDNRVFELKYRPKGKGLSWISHQNKLMGREAQRYEGFLLGVINRYDLVSCPMII
jgi:hypothetical protein